MKDIGSPEVSTSSGGATEVANSSNPLFDAEMNRGSLKPSISSDGMPSTSPASSAAPEAAAGDVAGESAVSDSASSAPSWLDKIKGMLGSQEGSSLADAGEVGTEGLSRLAGPAAVAYEALKSTPANADEDAVMDQKRKDYIAANGGDDSLFSRIDKQMQNQVAKGNVGSDDDSDDNQEETPTETRKPASKSSSDEDELNDDSWYNDKSDKSNNLQDLANALKSQIPQDQSEDPLQAAMNKRDSLTNQAEIGKYLNLAASGIGGVMNKGAAPTQVSNEMNDDLLKQANEPVQDFAMKQQFAQEQIKNDPNSGYSQLMRASLAKMGVNAPPTLTGGAIEKAFPTLAKVYDTQLQVEARRDAAKDNLQMRQIQLQDLAQRRQESQDYRNQVHNDQMSHQTDQDFEKFAGKMNAATASSRSLLGRTANSMNQADRVQALIDQTKNQPGGASPQQLYELARAQDALISGGSGTVSGTAHLVPSTALQSYANFQQWLTNSPQGANTQAFTSRIEDTVKRERNVAQQAQQKALNQMAPGFSHLKEKDPARYQSIMDSVVQQPEASPQASAPDASRSPQSQIPANAVKRQTADGRTAYFDPNTKQFLGWGQ